MVKCEICGKEFDKSKRRFQSKYNLCSNECKYIFLGNINRKHSMAHKTKLYGIWKALRQRCENPNDKSYKNYGARGICFCDEWQDFETFYNWSINNGYKYEPLKSGRNKWSIDRIDNDKGYSPENCRWTTDTVQAHNKQNSIRDDERTKKCMVCGKFFRIKRRNEVNKTCSKKCSLIQRHIEHQEKTKDKYKKECPICHKIFEERGGHFKDRITCSRECAKLNASPIWEFNGEKLRVPQWAEKIGINAHCLYHRKDMGWSIEKILTTPLDATKKRR